MRTIKASEIMAAIRRYDPQAYGALCELPALLKQLDSIPDYQKRIMRYERQRPGFRQAFEQYAASLKYDWAQASRIPRKEVTKRIRTLKVACARTAKLLLKHGPEYLLWHGLPRSALSRDYSENLPLGPPGVPLIDLLDLSLSERDFNARAMPLVRQALQDLADGIDLSYTPTVLKILPTKTRGKEARGVYFVRALTWFFIAEIKKSDDDVVSIVASTLSGRKKGIPPDHVAILRRRLMKDLDRT